MPVTSDAEHLAEVKSILRSLLVAKGNQMVTVHSLNRMYKEEETCWIPFRDFGYPNLPEFLRSISDTLTLYYNKDSDLCAKHVETEKTKHISSLIARQKTTTKKAKSSFTAYRNRGLGYHYTRPVSRTFMPSVSVISNILENLRDAAKKTGRHPGIKKADALSKIIEHVGRSTPYTILQLNNQLQGFGNKLHIIGDFIYFKEDWLKLQESKQPNISVSNGIKMITPSSNKHFQGNGTAADDYYSKPVAPVANQTINERYKIEYCNKSSVPDSTTKRTVSNNYFYQINSANSIHSRPNISGVNPHRCPTSNSDIQTNDGYDNRCPSSTIDSQVQSKNSQTIEKKRQEPETDRKINIMQQSNQVNSNADMIKERTKIRLQKLIEKHPEGIWSIELPSIYKKEYSLDLEYLDSGFNNITEFVAALPEIFNIEEIDRKQMLLDARTSTKSRSQKSTIASHYNLNDYVINDQDPVPLKLSTGVSNSLIPEGVMSLDEAVDPILVSSLSYEDYIEVVISEIFTPSFFWVNLRRNKKKLEALMTELSEFYVNCKHLQDYKVPQIVLEPGLNVACVYSKIWHRAIVKRIKPDGYVVVLFYDYGTVKTYNPNDLYFLHKKFSRLPVQAIPCGLYNIRPIDSNEWLHSVTSIFVKKVWNIPLVAIISVYNDENNTMMITLTDTNDDHIDVHINDWMTEQKLAEYGKMVCIKNNFVYKHYQDCLLQKASSRDNEKNIFTSPENSFIYDTKLSDLRKYQMLNFSISNSSSSDDELVYVFDDREFDQRNLINNKLFERLKGLGKTRTEQISDHLQNDLSRKLKNISFSKKLLCKKDEILCKVDDDSTLKKNQYIEDYDNCDFYDNHGRMNPIDWSTIYENTTLSRSKSLFHRLKNLY